MCAMFGQEPPPDMDTLPIFVTLAHRAVIIVGESEAAAAKARLVLAAGGRVADETATEAALAFVALDDETAAKGAAARLRERGLLVNVVDRPALSDFLMGSIVDRSPVVVAISTGGGSASLARALRGRFEALLPAGLGGLARAIRAARRATNAAHPTMADRRRLWEAALAPGGPLDPFAALPDADVAVTAAIAGATPVAADATVTIIVTSDDPGDLTLNQLALLGRCDALRVEGDVAAAVIDRARRDAVRLGAGETVPGLTLLLRLG